MFWISSCLLWVRAGSRGPVQSNHCEGTGRRVRLSGTSLCLKRLVSSQIIGGAGAEWRVRRSFWGYMRHSLCVDDGTIGPCPVCPRSVFLGFVKRSKEPAPHVLQQNLFPSLLRSRIPPCHHFAELVRLDFRKNGTESCRVYKLSCRSHWNQCAPLPRRGWPAHCVKEAPTPAASFLSHAMPKPPNLLSRLYTPKRRSLQVLSFKGQYITKNLANRGNVRQLIVLEEASGAVPGPTTMATMVEPGSLQPRLCAFAFAPLQVRDSPLH
jgi:hypothetical protein